MKRLPTIFTSIANYVCVWAVDLEVEFLFGGGYFASEMLRKSGEGWQWRHFLNNGQTLETSDDGYALESLLSVTPRPSDRSGRYRLITALPM